MGPDEKKVSGAFLNSQKLDGFSDGVITITSDVDYGPKTQFPPGVVTGTVTLKLSKAQARRINRIMNQYRRTLRRECWKLLLKRRLLIMKIWLLWLWQVLKS